MRGTGDGGTEGGGTGEGMRGTKGEAFTGCRETLKSTGMAAVCFF